MNNQKPPHATGITRKAGYLVGLECSVLQIRNLLDRIMQRLATELDETVFMAMQTGTYYHYDKSWRPCPLRGLPIGIGKDEEMFHTAVGKVYMAFSPSLRRSLNKYYPGVINKKSRDELRIIEKQKYAIDREQYQAGLNCIAFPIIHKGKILTIVGTFAPASRLDINKIDQTILLFKKAIKEIEGLL